MNLKNCILGLAIFFASYCYAGEKYMLLGSVESELDGVGMKTTIIALAENNFVQNWQPQRKLFVGKTAPGDTIYVDDTVEFKGAELKDWFFPQQLELVFNGNSSVSNLYQSYSVFGTYNEQRNMGGVGLVYRISHLSGFNQIQHFVRFNSEFGVQMYYHESKRDFNINYDRYYFPSFYDQQSGLHYSVSNYGNTYYSSLWVMPEYRFMVRVSDFRESHGKYGLEASVGLAYLKNIRLANSGNLVEDRAYYNYNSLTGNYTYRYSKTSTKTYGKNESAADYMKYDACVTARAGIYCNISKKAKLTVGAQITTPSIGTQTADIYFRLHWLLGERENRDRSFKR